MDHVGLEERDIGNRDGRPATPDDFPRRVELFAVAGDLLQDVIDPPLRQDVQIPALHVHLEIGRTAVERAGLPALNEGDRLDFELEVDRRGKYAAVNLQSKAE